MTQGRALGAWQVAALLVSASYGIGFLFGSGEMALTHGMGGALYGVATAFGMLLLGTFAAPLWRGGMPIWDWFGQAYGTGLRSAVALLSVIWMAGVLAAQIHGGVAILTLLGAQEWVAYCAVLAGIYVAARLDLRVASMVFSFFLLASGAVLVQALLAAGGGAFYLRGPAQFVSDLGTFPSGELLAMTVAIVALVCTGADYHQFVLAGRRPVAAVTGCLLAALCLAAVSFLPVAVVLALQAGGGLDELKSAKQVIPLALAKAASPWGALAGKILLLGLSGAALGSGAAILRAMTSALASATHRPARSPWLALCALAVGAALAARGQGIVATMVSVNIVYIGGVAALFAALLMRWELSRNQALRILAAGLAGSLAVYLAAWAGKLDGNGDFPSLLAGLLCSGAVMALECVLRRGAMVRNLRKR
ncbi:MAG: hypothetical protein QM586_17870 [Xenophilus sp.]